MRLVTLLPIVSTLLVSTAASLTFGFARSATAATLPEHDPLGIVVIADEVNPWNLSDAELTQPQDLVAALAASDSGLNTTAVVGIDSQCVDEAFDMVDETADVVVYFAHLAAKRCDGTDAQDELVAALVTHLERGGGIVVFHHGLYVAEGKNSVLRLIGAAAQGVSYGADGQAAINVAPEHFVTTNGLDYPTQRDFGDRALGIPDGSYATFNNSPDERYDNIDILTIEGERREILFTNAASQVISYDLTRPGWLGRVVTYQPGEYQPLILDDRDGLNFQVLANAIFYAATVPADDEPPMGDPTEGDSGAENGTNEEDGDDGETEGSSPNPDPDSDTGSQGSGTEPTNPPADGDSGSCSVHPMDSYTQSVWILAVLGLGVAARRRRIRSIS